MLHMARVESGGVIVRGIAIIGGESPGPEALKRIVTGAELLVAADSGLMAAENAGIKVDWVVGDMDSLDDTRRLEKYPPDRVLRFPSGKDYTDTELALALLREKGCDEIWLAGGGGGRTDQLFAIRALFERDDPPVRWYPGDEEIHCLVEGKILNTALPPESLVSVFPLGKGPWDAVSSGLKWPLKGLSWNRGSFGLSNLVLDGPFEIHSIKGRFMVIIPGSK